MSDILSSTEESSDAELISAVRAGDTESYGHLFGRHRDAANRLARQLLRGPDADDLVAESFIRVLAVLRAGKGPDESFRAYLLTSIRRLHIDRIRAAKRVRSTDDDAELDRAIEFVDPEMMRFERSAAAAAFSSLPERWQLVLWHLDVEGQKPTEIAPLLGMSANSVSALAYRAREGLRQAYLQGHLAPTLHVGCRNTTTLLGSYVRKGLSARDAAMVEKHLDDCCRCTGLYLELAEVNSNLSGILGPALLGTAAAEYLATSAAAATGAALVVKGAVAHAAEVAFGPIKVIAAGAGTQGVVAVTVVAGLATAGTIAVVTSSRDTPTAQQVPISTSAPYVAPTSGPNIRKPSRPVPAESDPTPTPTDVPVTATPSGPTPATELTPTDATPIESTPIASPHSEDPVVAPPAPTDYGIVAVNIANDGTFLQRRYTIPISATTDGRAVAHQVTVHIAFRSRAVFRGVVSPGWDCGTATPNSVLTTLTCTKTLPAGQGTTFITKARSLFQSGVATVSTPDDPNRANNSRTFRAGLWLPV